MSIPVLIPDALTEKHKIVHTGVSPAAPMPEPSSVELQIAASMNISHKLKSAEPIKEALSNLSVDLPRVSLTQLPTIVCLIIIKMPE